MSGRINTIIRILGIISPIALPLLVILIQQQWTIFRYPEINTVIPVSLFLTGVASGALIRAWWPPLYILALGIALITFFLLQEEYPGSDSHAIAVEFLFTLVPLIMLGAIVGILAGKLTEKMLRYITIR